MSSSSRQSDRSSARSGQRGQKALPYYRTERAREARPWLGWLEKLNPVTWLSWSSAPMEEAAERLKQRGEELAKNVVQAAQAPPQVDDNAQQLPEQPQDIAPPPPPPPGRRIEQPTQALPDEEIPATQDASMDTDAQESLEPEAAETTKQKLDAVKLFLSRKSNKKLNLVEMKGIMALLRECTDGDNVEEDKPEPFRFSSSPSVTPVAEAAPIVDFTAPGAAPAPRKMLDKNPNGIYRINGAGSARPRHRYTHPGFPVPRRPHTALPKSPENTKADGKRRRMDESSSPLEPAPAPASSSASASTTSADLVACSSSPLLIGTTRARPNVATSATATKPKTPARPSPLRQNWDDSPTPPQQKTPPKPTASASYLAGLIDKVTPPKKSDIANPYEALPFGRRATRRPPQKKVQDKAAVEPKPEPQPATSSSKQPQQTQEKAKELKVSAQAVIGATVPVGSARARPPANFQASKSRVVSDSSPAPATSAPKPVTFGETNDAPRTTSNKRSSSVIIEGISDEESEAPAKRSRTNGTQANGWPSRPSPSVTIEEIDNADTPPPLQPSPSPTYTRPTEVVEPLDERSSRSRSTSPVSPATSYGNISSSSSSSLGSRPSFSNLKSSAPKVPSKLRYSANLEEEEREREASADSLKQRERQEAKAAAADHTLTSPPPTVTPASVATITLHCEAPEPAKLTIPKTPELAKVTVPKVPEPAKVTLPKAPTEKDARAAALAVPEHALPMYAFDLRTSSPGAGPSTYEEQARKAALAVPRSDLPKYDFSALPAVPKPAATGFNWAAAGIKPPPKPAGDSWACTMCGLTNPASALEKCTICETLRPESTKVREKSAPAKGFDWAAAGMKPPLSTVDAWNCDVCGLSNPADVKEKCKICEAPRPGKPKVTSGGFDWAAAGMKPPAASTSSWTCSVCALQNPSDASKCTICDAPR